MKGYSEREVFTQRELNMYTVARRMTEEVLQTHLTRADEEVRCHELARAVSMVLDLESWKLARTETLIPIVEDGKFLSVDHSWIVIVEQRTERIVSLLDVYAVASHPMVQLYDLRHWGVMQRRSMFKRDASLRRDIDFDLVRQMAELYYKLFPVNEVMS